MDIVVLVVLVMFFLLAFGLVRLCERIVGSDLIVPGGSAEADPEVSTGAQR